MALQPSFIIVTAYWNVVKNRGKEVAPKVVNFSEDGYLLKRMNHSKIVLIPKLDIPSEISAYQLLLKNLV